MGEMPQDVASRRVSGCRGPGLRRSRWRPRASPAAGRPARRGFRRGRAGRRRAAPGRPATRRATVPTPSTEAASASRGVSACSGCHGRPVVGRAVHGGRDRQPRVQRRHRRVRAEGQLDAGVEHPAEHEAAVGPVRPAPLGQVAVVEQVRRLHAGPQAQSRASRGTSSRAISWACSIEPRAPVAAYAVERLVRPPRRRSRGWRPRGRARARGSAGSRSSVGVRLAARGYPAVPSAYGVAAPGRPGVQRAVGDDLERTHVSQRVAAGQQVAGAQPGGEYSSRVSGYVAARTRSSAGPGRPSVQRLPNSRSTSPTTPRAAAARMVRSGRPVRPSSARRVPPAAGRPRTTPSRRPPRRAPEAEASGPRC